MNKLQALADAVERVCARMDALMVPKGPSLRVAAKDPLTGKIWTGRHGEMHGDVLEPEANGITRDAAQRILSTNTGKGFKSGFVNHKGHYLDRGKAVDYALEHNLVHRMARKRLTGPAPAGGHELMSEDLKSVHK